MFLIPYVNIDYVSITKIVRSKLEQKDIEILTIQTKPRSNWFNWSSGTDPLIPHPVPSLAKF